MNHALRQIHEFEGFDVISRYTRAQAIDDGVLVDMMRDELGTLVREAGIRVPVAMTAMAFGELLGEIPESAECPAVPFDIGRWWDVLWMLRLAIRANTGRTDTVLFPVVTNASGELRNVLTKAVCGPDDNLKPCITIMLAGED